jgi:cytochrome P450
LRDQCPVGFDERLGAWVVTTYEGCRQMLSADVVDFRHVDQATDPFLVKLSGGARQLKFLYGDEHHRVHHWWLRAFSPKAVAPLQETLIRPIVDVTVDRFVESGRAELWSDVAARIPVRAIAAMMGLPFEDDPWIEEIAHQLDLLAEFFDKRFLADEQIRSTALAATERITEILLPTIRARRKAKGTDMISRLWAVGPSLLDSWSEEDVITHVHNMFVGGKDTTTLAIANAVYLLVTEPHLVETLLADPSKVEQFVEESLRLEAPVQFRVRLTAKDLDLEEVRLQGGDTIVPLIASAGRDPLKWGPDADEVKLDRPLARTHMAFLYGPRTCVGAALARAELNEVVKVVLSRIPDVTLDPDAPAPEYAGYVLRAHRPLNVVFTPGVRSGATLRSTAAWRPV